MTATNIPAAPELSGFGHVYSGKVRDLYRAADGNLLFVASDRISAFDWVLPSTIPDKGAILTALSLWWFEATSDIVGNHVLSVDVPEAVRGRAMICAPLDMFPIECVARGYLTGSGLADYRSTGAVCGVALPPGLVDGSKLAEPIFTPATKAAVGDHDENVDLDSVIARIGASQADELRSLTLNLYARAHEIASQRGLILADTKFEFGRPAGKPDAPILVADEVLTPDSSRFWAADRWIPGQSGGQPSFDKQFVRNWLASPDSGWNPRGQVPPPPLPADVVERTRALYVRAYELLTGYHW